MGIIFIPGQFTHALTFLRWARHYFGLYQMDETGNKTIDQNRWRNISLTVILSMIALETFLNEMAILALRECPSPFNDGERLILLEKYRNKKGEEIQRYLSTEDKLIRFTKLITKRDFPKEGAGSYRKKLRTLIKFRNKLVHHRVEDFIPISMEMLSGIPSMNAKPVIDGIPSIFSAVEEGIDFDPADTIKQIIIEIEKLGYPLLSSVKRNLQQV